MRIESDQNKINSV